MYSDGWKEVLEWGVERALIVEGLLSISQD